MLLPYVDESNLKAIGYSVTCLSVLANKTILKLRSKLLIRIRGSDILNSDQTFYICGISMVQNAKIIVIDDDEVIRDSLAMVLEQEGFVVDTAENGQEAIAKTFSNFYNLAIVDWKLPDTDGTKLLGALKETEPKMVKIMLTGYPSTNTAIAAVNYRADAFFSKPVNIDSLIERIKKLLKEQEESRRFSEEKMTQFIETRAKEILKTRLLNPASKLSIE